MIECQGIYLPDGEDHLQSFLDSGQKVDGKGTYQFGKYQRALPWVRPSRDIALDIGAHVGLWSRILYLDFKGVIAFEPLPEHFACLQRNMKHADPDRFRLVPAALGAEEGIASIQSPSGNSGSAHLAPGGSLRMAHQVAVLTLDSILDQTGGIADGRSIDFIKIDVEGFERAVVAGGEQTIREYRPAMIVEQKPGHGERFGFKRGEAVRLLESWGAVVREVISGDYILSWD